MARRCGKSRPKTRATCPTSTRYRVGTLSSRRPPEPRRRLYGVQPSTSPFRLGLTPPTIRSPQIALDTHCYARTLRTAQKNREDGLNHPPQKDPSKNRALTNFPGIPSMQKLVQIPRPALRNYILNLLIHHILIPRQIRPPSENPNRSRKSLPVLHMRQGKCVVRARMMHIMHEQIPLGDAVAELDDFDVAVRFAPDALVAIFAEDHWLAVFELQHMLAACLAFGDRKP